MAKRTCSIDGCPGNVLARGWCSKHYQSWRHHDDPLYTDQRAAERSARPTACKVGTCDTPVPEPGGARGLCHKHYEHWKKHGDPEARGVCKGCDGPMQLREGYDFCTRNPKCRKLGAAANRAKHQPRVKAARARWAAENPEKIRASWAKYKARTDRPCGRPTCPNLAAKGYAYCRPHLNEQSAWRIARNKTRLLMRLYRRQRGRCPDAEHGGCGKPLTKAHSNHVDHIIPSARGGPDEDWNLQLMHPDCNLHKCDRIVPAAVALAEQHGVTMLRPDGSRPRKRAA